MTDRREHWDRVYSTRAPDKVSWFQPVPDRSLRLIHAAAPDRGTPIIDIGGGVSTLAGELLRSGYAYLTILDISSEALQRARTALGEASDGITWITADITLWQPPRQWMVWHDRAVFHFLTERPQQEAYIGALHGATAAGATVIVATFALDGPERCSGLPVQRYSPTTLAERLGPSFVLVDRDMESHLTPAGAAQRFSYAVLRRL